MSFKLFEGFFNKFDTATATFVTDISSNLISAITPVVYVGLTLGFLIYSLAIIRGAVDTPVLEFLWRSFRIGVIVSVATAGGLYQSQIAGLITTVPDDLANLLIAGTSSPTAASVLDTATDKGFQVASKAFEKQGWFSSEGWLYGGFGMLSLLATGILVAVGGAFIILAKVALALLAGLGPLFIFALLWQSTSRFFEMWTAQVLNYGFLIVLISTVFMLIMGIFGSYMEGISLDGTQNLAYTFGGATIISVASIILLLQLPSIASGLAGGVGLSYMWEARMVRGGMGSFGSKNSSGNVTGRSGVAGAIGSAGSAAGAAAGKTANVAKKIAGFARGKLTG